MGPLTTTDSGLVLEVDCSPRRKVVVLRCRQRDPTNFSPNLGSLAAALRTADTDWGPTVALCSKPPSTAHAGEAKGRGAVHMSAKDRGVDPSRSAQPSPPSRARRALTGSPRQSQHRRGSSWRPPDPPSPPSSSAAASRSATPPKRNLCPAPVPSPPPPTSRSPSSP